MSQRIYGNNISLLNGRFIAGPDARSCVATLMMIAVPSILWQVQVGTFFAERHSALIPIVAFVLQVTSLTFLLATAFSDPGIIPRQKDYTEQYDARSKTYRKDKPPKQFDMMLRVHPFKVKHCPTCNIYRPPRTTHCSVCENCIERFDHHCPWIGNCVGKRNYRLFYTFVSVTGALNAYSLLTAVAQVSVYCSEFQDTLGMAFWDALLEAMGEVPLAVAMVAYTACIVWFTVGLCMYHNYLISTNQTTYESIKGAYTTGNNPFNRGILGNYRDVLFSPVRPRYLDASKNGGNGAMLWCNATSEPAKIDADKIPHSPHSSADGEDKENYEDYSPSGGYQGGGDSL
mmetsp:Transcript_12759/g.37926  ORF Transcript_12759/g.37926 Transcript_12759/m.37926 type:complete len:344 (-) Transcript_12759:10-1041(-)